MKFYSNISVRLKIVIIITTISTISVLLSLIVNLTTRIVDSKKEYRADAIKDAKLLGDYCVMPIEFNYPDRAKEVLETRISRGNIFCAAVYNKNGGLFSKACSGGVAIPTNLTPEQSKVMFEANELIVIEPIIHKGNFYGSVYIKYYTGIKSVIVRQVISTVLVLLVILLLSFSLALHFQKYISLPILKLADKASEISETQDYKVEIPKSGNDEVGILYDSFNQMLNTINSREIERDNANEALKQSEEKFRNIFNFSLDGILVTDFEGKILEASKMAATIFHLPIDGLKGHSMLEIMPPGYSRQRSIIIQELENKGGFTFVTNYKTKTQKEVHLEFSSKIINHDGSRAILSLIRDITKRIKSDEALRESEERYKKLVENFPSAIALHREGKIIFVNDGIKTTLNGKSKSDFVGKAILDLIAEDHQQLISKHFEVISEQNKASATLEAKMKNQNGKEIDVEMSSIPLFFDRKKTILTVFKDISSRKAIEQDLVVALKHAEESDRLKSAFLANMSHEIRTPMNGIIGFADLLNKSNLERSDIKRYVDVIKASAGKLLAIINDIIDISKIEAGVVNITRELFDLNPVIKEIYQFYLPQAVNRGLEFSLTCNEDRQIRLNSDKSKVSQIITNLISNALKYTRQGFVSIGCNVNAEATIIEIVVEDSGIGIPEEQKESIFERFNQAEHYLQDFNEGTGLGLSICKGFVDALGGEIWVESEMEKGSKFHLELPIEGVNPKPLKDIEPLEKIVPPNLTGKSILIVEDEENNYLYLKEVLIPLGATVYWADDGLKAIQVVLENPGINFVLMDIKLPIMDGFTAARKIKSYRNNLPIVAQTAFGLEGDKEKSLAAGLDDYIPKPIKQEELFNLLEKYL